MIGTVMYELYVRAACFFGHKWGDRKWVNGDKDTSFYYCHRCGVARFHGAPWKQ